MIKKFTIVLILFLTAISFVNADVLVLKSGKKLKGVISRSRPGKIALKTKQGKVEFNDSQVSFKLTKLTKPVDAEKAFDLLKKKKYEQAAPIFQKWEKRYKDLPLDWYERALYGLGTCLANTGKSKEAMPYLKKLLEMFPETQRRNEAEYWLIETQLSGKPGPELEKKLKELLDNSKTGSRIRAKAHQGLASYYESLNQKQKALEEYVKIIVLYGDIDELQENSQMKCADLFANIGRTNEALFYYKQIIEAYPKTDSAKSAEKKLSSFTTVKGE